MADLASSEQFDKYVKYTIKMDLKCDRVLARHNLIWIFLNV